MGLEKVILKLPGTLLADAQVVASGQDVTIGHLVRELLRKEVDRRSSSTTSDQTNGGLVAALQALLAKDIALADGWDDLENRLARHGYEVRPVQDGLTLHKRNCGKCICNLSELGFAYRDLVNRFKTDMPGHPRGALNMSSAKPAPDRFRIRLIQIFDHAQSWAALIQALDDQGCFLQAQGAGLAIYQTKSGRHLCNTATVGYRYRKLVSRFGTPLPGHPHPLRSHPAPTLPEQDDFDVIERF